MTQPVDYDAVIAGLQAQIDDLKAQHAAVTKALSGWHCTLDPKGAARLVQRGNREIARRG